MPTFRYQATEITLDEAVLGESFRQLFEGMDTTSLHADIGETLLISTDERFEAEVAPDGTPWAPLSPATLASAFTAGNASRQRKRRTTKRGGEDTAGFERFRARKKILQELGIRGGLRGSIAYEAEDGSLRVGTSKAYGRAHQFGLGARSSVGGRAFAALPARPFIGLSDEDEAVIADIVVRWSRGRLGL
ncbi:MAG: phage virion morphogenesis protein [Bacteroidota bacterium]